MTASPRMIHYEKDYVNLVGDFDAQQTTFDVINTLGAFWIQFLILADFASAGTSITFRLHGEPFAGFVSASTGKSTRQRLATALGDSFLAGAGVAPITTIVPAYSVINSTPADTVSRPGPLPPYEALAVVSQGDYTGGNETLKIDYRLFA